MSKKRTVRREVRLEPGEALVVLPLEFWKHIMETYKTHALHDARDQEEAASWMGVYYDIESQIEDSTQEEWDDWD